MKYLLLLLTLLCIGCSKVPCVDDVTNCPKCNTILINADMDCSNSGCLCGNCYIRCPRCKYTIEVIPTNKCDKDN